MKITAIRWVICLAASALAMTGCSGGGADEMVASAKSYIAKSDNKAAIIQLKNALQKSPDSGEVRFLLGKALFDTGEVVAATVELGKALELKYPESKVLPVLAQALNVQGQYEALISRYGDRELDDPAANAVFKTSLAGALASVNKLDAADKALTAALSAAPNHLPAQLLQIRLKAIRNDVNGAVAQIESVLRSYPESSDAWQLKGNYLLQVKGDYPAAMAAFKKAVDLKKSNVSAHTGLLSLYVSQRDMTAARAQLDELKRVLPLHPQTKYFEALLAYENKDYKSAREIIQQLLRYSSDDGNVLQLAAMLELQTKSHLQAEVYLNKALQAAPQLTMARRLLAFTYLGSGQTSKALAALQPLLDRPSPDAESLALAGQAYLQAGEHGKADEYFLRASKLNPADAKSRTALALSQLAKGNVELAFGELQQVASVDKGTVANMALISAHLRRGEMDAALQAVDALERKQPDKPFAAELRGRIYASQKNFDAARKSFEQSLKIDRTYYPSASSLAALDLMENKPDQARKRFDSVLAADAKNLQALLAIAQLRAKTGASKEEVAGLLANAVKLNPTESASYLALIEHHLLSNEPKLALAAAQSAVTTLPQSAELLEALGQVQQASGDTNQAVITFSKLVSMQPQSLSGYLRLSGAQRAQQDNDAGLQTLKRALSIKADYLPAQQAMIQLDVAAGRVKYALATARTITAQRPGESVGLTYEGDIEVAQKNWDAAIKAYRSALGKTASSELAIKLYGALVGAKKMADADTFAATWMKSHPSDVSFVFYLGDSALARNEYAQAEGHYQTVKRMSPNNAAALNNIAWLLYKQKKPGALPYAQQAVKLMPDQAAFLDTLAMVLDSQQDPVKAIEVQKRSVELQPLNGAYRLKLAKLYLKNGQKSLAKAELESLAKMGKGFGAQDEVSQLLRTL